MWLVAICVAVAAAPWLSGGQLPLALLLSGMAMLLGSLMLWRQPAVRNFRGGPLSWYYLAFVGWGILSLAWSVNRFSTVMWLIPLFLAGLAFRLAYTIAGIPTGREAVIRLYLASALMFCVYALWLYFTGGYERLTGSFYWANPAAAYLMPAILIAVHRTLKSNWRYWGPLSVLYTASFLLADSRASSFVLVIITAGYLAAAKPKKADWIILVFIVIGTIILTSGAVQLRHYLQPHGIVSAPGGRFAEVAKGESQSGNDRVSYLIAAYKIWLTAPLAGTGAGTYADAHPAFQTSPLNASSSAHNIYAQTLPELGIIGFVLLVGLLVSLPLGLLRGITEAPDNLVLVFGAAALLLHMGLDIDAQYPSILVLVAVMLGLIYTQSYRSWSNFSWRLPFASVIVMVPIISFYLADGWAVRAAAAQADNDYPTAADYFGRSTSGLVYNPDWLSAEGINHYAVAASGSTAQSQSAETDVALMLARSAQRQDPRDGQHHQLEGRILALEKRYPEAVRAFEMALKLDSNDHPEYALDLAYAQLAMGEDARAVATAQSMVAKYPPGVTDNRSVDTTVKPNLADLSALIGNYYLARGDLAKAQAAATQALAYYPAGIRARALQHQLDLRK